MAYAGEAVFWRIDKNADYGVLNDLARGSVNARRIEQHWDDMLRIAGSLKLGTIQASELICSLLKSDRPSSLTKAIIEAGCINKCLYLLNYIDDEDYRRRIGLVTNAVVLWNTLYMQAALDHLRQQPQEIREEDRVRGGRSLRLPTEPCVRVRTRLIT